jgi:phosphate transport system ATP-binding protein
MSIYENIAFGVRLYERLPKSELDNRMETSLRRSALWDEVKDKLSARACRAGSRERLCICADRGGATGSDPARRAVLGARSDLDRQDRGIDRRLKEDYTIVIVTHNMQQAARVSEFTTFMYLGELIEFDTTSKVFTAPDDPRTQDYIYRPVRASGIPGRAA